MTRPRITKADLHLSDLARMQATAAHGYVAALWRMPGRDGKYSLLRLERDRETMLRYVDRATLGECVVVAVAELLAEINDTRDDET